MTKTVTIAATRANGDPYAFHDVIVTLVAGSAGGVVGSNVVVESSTVRLDADGEGSISLATNDVEVTSPTTSFYRFTVEGSSPTISRSIELTDALASTVSWTLADIQVGDPVTPERDVSSDYVQVAGVGSLTNVLTGLGALVPLVSDLETTVDGLGNDVTALEAADTALAAGALADAAAAADHTRSETLARRQTDPLLALCAEWGVGGHDDAGYSTDAPSGFTDGMWLRFTVTPLPVPDFGTAADGTVRYSEIFTLTGDGEGIWDLIEAALERKYDAAAGVWRSFLFLEITFVGGTVETISLSTSSSSSAGGTTYPVWEVPEGVPTECAMWFDFANGDGVWDLKFLRRTHYGTAEVTADGAEWDVISRAVGAVAGSIATSIYPWWIGAGHGALLLNEMQIRNGGPAGTLLARPTAALAAAAGEGVAFTDGQGNEWTPGTDAAIFDPTATGGVPTSRTITAGTGLTGGGTLAADRTLAIDAAVLARIGTSVDATGDLTRLNNTLADDGELTFTGTSGTRYWIDAFVALSGDATADAKVGIVIPGGTMCVMAEHPAANISTYPTTQQMTVLTASAATAQVGVLAGGTTVCRLSGWVDLTSTGTVCVHWAQNNTGAGTGVTRLAKSRITYRT